MSAAGVVVRRKLVSLRGLAWGERARVAEAALLLSAARLTLCLVPYRWFKPWLTAGRPGAAADPLVASNVRRAVALASRNLPFAVPCLPQAMAAKLMLARRGVGSSSVVGAGHDDARAMILHAWLESGGMIVTGAAARPSFTPVVNFGGPTGP